jgi:hypothetical protein
LDRLKREKRQRDMREKQAKAEMERLWKEEEEKDLKERKDEDELARLKEERKKKEHRTKAKQAEIERLRQESMAKQRRENEQVEQLKELESATKSAATKIEAQSRQVCLSCAISHKGLSSLLPCLVRCLFLLLERAEATAVVFCGMGF